MDIGIEMFRRRGIGVIALLVALIFAISLLAVRGISYAADEARQVAVEHLRLQTSANALALQAILTSCRNDFLFLSQSGPLANYRQAILAGNPMVRRWHRIEIEATLLLFLSAHSEVEWIWLQDGEGGSVFVAAGRRENAPVLLSPADFDASVVRDTDGFLMGQWPTASAQSGILHAALRIARLVEMAAPAEASRLIVKQGSPIVSEPLEAPAGAELISTPVEYAGWNPPVHWTLLRVEPTSGLISSVSRLGERYRSTLILNLALLSLALLLGVLAFWQVRRGLVLEADNLRQARTRELDRQVLHQERLVTVGRLATGLAHEINNPLEGMANYLKLLEDEIQDNRTEESLKMIAKVREGLKRASAVTRQVLTFADPAEAPKTEVDVKELLRQTIGFVGDNPLFHHISIHASFAEHEVRIMGNAVTLGQLFLNLLLNACQQPSRTNCVEITCEAEHGETKISFFDDGPGLSAEILPRIFEPFFSTRGSTGLGLSVCLGIARQHGGRIEASNRENGGAVFSVHFPCKTGSPKEPADHSPSAFGRRSPCDTSAEAQRKER